MSTAVPILKKKQYLNQILSLFFGSDVNEGVLK